MQACRLWSHTVDVTPPQAATKIMAGMAEQQTEWRNQRMAGMAGMTGMAGMAERMAEWQNGRNWIQRDTYVLFMVHANNDTLIFYSIDRSVCCWICPLTPHQQ